MKFGAVSFAILSLLVVAAASPVPLHAANVDYLTQVKPLLTARCGTCHGGLKQQASLRLDAASLALKGGKHGPVIVPGKSNESRLIVAITGGGGDVPKMPEEGEPLKPEQVEILKRWIDEGANAPADEAIPAGPEAHWAFKPPVRPAVPQVSDARWSGNPIDAFVAAEHARRGLKPQPEVDKPTLLRRVTLDLTGLPPTRAELHAFLADASPDAYEKVVDRLLASPTYGERWGRHWMDVWRYSDWYGYGKEVRFSQPHIWRWRDWIVESLNSGKPYDEMVREMLAADEIAPADLNMARANGFLARHWSLYNRNGWMEEAVEHTGKAFLGMTFNCARCHDHMFDPVSQKEYFGFRAIFEPYDVRRDPAPGGSADTTADGIARVVDGDAKRPTYLFIRGDDRNPKKDEVIAPTVPASLKGTYAVTPVMIPPAGWYNGLREDVRKSLSDGADATVAEAEKALVQSETALAAARDAYSTTVTANAATPAPTAASTQPSAIFADTFATARPDAWRFESGQWTYKEGKLVQSERGQTFKRASTLAQHPPELSATLAFKITGGDYYHSVGLAFDVTDAGDAQGIYLSANKDKPALSTCSFKAGEIVYDGTTVPLPLKPNEPYEVRAEVRGQLLNVYVNNVLAMAQTLKSPRQAGGLGLLAFDSSAEFTSVRIDGLGANVKLVEKLEKPPTAIPSLDPKQRLTNAATALRSASESNAIERQKVDVARTARTALAAKIAADDAVYATPRKPEADQLALAAGHADRTANLAKAELAALTAQHAMAAAQLKFRATSEPSVKALTDAGLKVVEQGAAVAAARAALDKPSPTYSPITNVWPSTSTGRRLALAKWITARENPLAARVAVNHIWLRHFGGAIVPTVFDFGLNGKPPTNQPLLDWLAVEFMDDKYDMKRLHRLMVTSATYRMRSDTAGADDATRKADPDNVYLWRRNVGRMEAEVVRDSMLAVAGQLDLTRGGPEIDHGQGLVARRRSLYFRHAHEKQMTFLKTFDVASVNECYRRDQSVMPQQALAMANSPLALAESRRLASILTNQVGGGSADPRAAFVAAAFEQLLSRAPSADERSTCEQFLAEQASRFATAADLDPFAAGDANSIAPSRDPNQRARENLVHVLMNHNDFVTIR